MMLYSKCYLALTQGLTFKFIIIDLSLSDWIFESGRLDITVLDGKGLKNILLHVRVCCSKLVTDLLLVAEKQKGTYKYIQSHMILTHSPTLIMIRY